MKLALNNAVKILERSPLFRAVNTLRWEIRVRNNISRARKLGFHYWPLEPGFHRSLVTYAPNGNGRKRYGVRFPDGDHRVITVTPERGYEDIDGKAHESHYLSALGQSGKRGKALDCACGSGYGSNLLAAYFDSVIGVDINEDVISYARKRYGLVNKLQFHCQDAASLTDIDGPFDLIVCVETMEHVERDDVMLERFYSLLAPGGLLYITVPYTLDQRIVSPFHVREYTLDGFRSRLTTAFQTGLISVNVVDSYIVGICSRA